MSATPLFHPRVVKKAINNGVYPPDIEQRHRRLDPLLAQLKSGELHRTNEAKLQGEFLRTVFSDVLGYETRLTGTGAVWDIEREENVAAKGRQAADGAIGWFHEGQAPVIHGVIEFKGASQALDRAADRSRTPVQQVWDYANETRTCRWILLSNFKETRLYHRGRSSHDIVTFQLADLASLDEFKRFWLMLAKTNLLPDKPGGMSPLDNLLLDSDKAQLEITNKLYRQYRETRQELFEDLRRVHGNRPALDILRLTQKLLDRVLFIAFAEDRDLLPRETIQQALTEDFYERPLWDNLKQIFTWVDAGRPAKGFPAFNGGLFAPDDELDDLEPSNASLKKLGQIAAYDFGEDVSVEVLGHIFEQSIADLEELRAQAAGAEAPQLSKRKQQGVFYTPAYVTRYLVEQTVGRSMTERLDEIMARHQPEKVKGKKKQRLAAMAAWTEYRDALKTLRVLDPACGSGAFLTATFDRLHVEYSRVDQELLDLRGDGQRELWDLNRTILNGNLFGVDLNPESIEITKLSLWLKTASRGNKLTWLDANIRCGNSVVSDPKVDPRAFDWSKGTQAWHALEDEGEAAAAVAAIWTQGFDIVIGNPPYIRQELLTDIKEHLKGNYRAWHGMADIFVYFFERGLSVLKPGGRLGFIVANKWMKGGYAAPLRRILAAETAVEEVIDFGHAPIFPDADAFPCIITMRKPSEGEVLERDRLVQATAFPREDLKDKGIGEFVKERQVAIPQSEFGEAPWSLEPPGVRRIMGRMRETGVRLEDFAGASPYRGVVTGCNEAFIIDADTRHRILLEDPGADEIIRPYLRGRDVKRWNAVWDGDYMIFARRGIDLELYPGAVRHLESFRTRLEPKPTKWPAGERWTGRKPGRYAWYEIQDSVDYWREFSKPKIVYQVIQFHPSYALDNDGLLGNDKVFFIACADPWLLAVLNSPLMWWHSWRFLVHMKDEALNPACVKMVDLPVVESNSETQAEAQELVAANIDATGSTQQAIRDLLMWLKTEHGIDKAGNALSDPAGLTTEAFVQEVRKRRPRAMGKPSPGELRELRELHEETRLPLLQRRQSIAVAERRLSDLVNAAYGLSDEDVDLIRRTAPPRMPQGLAPPKQ